MCDFTAGIPPVGSCEGPIDRALAKLRYIKTSKDANGGCGADSIAFYPDGDTNAKPVCGECNPRKVVVDAMGQPLKADFEEECGLNNYCTDKGLCEDIENHPNWLASCPTDSSGVCGTGLTCLLHKCSICVEGEYRIDSENGERMCIGSRWENDHYKLLNQDPMHQVISGLEIIALILVCDMAVSLAHLLFAFFKALCGNSRSSMPSFVSSNKKAHISARSCDEEELSRSYSDSCSEDGDYIPKKNRKNKAHISTRHASPDEEELSKSYSDSRSEDGNCPPEKK